MTAYDSGSTSNTRGTDGAAPDRSGDPQRNPHAPPQTYQHGQPSGGDETGHGPDTHHVGLPVYLAVFAVLMVLLVVTVAAAFVHFGSHVINTMVAMTIAVIKAVVVVLWFMHVKYSSRLTRVFVVAALFWLAIMATLTFSDYLTRDKLPSSSGWSDNLPIGTTPIGHGGPAADPGPEH
jgi:cytochrome c oxidase subunit 4